MELSILKKLGLDDKEIKIYITILANGAMSVRSLAEETGINRGTTYDVLKKLQEAGLISYYHQDTKQKFVAEDPEKIIKMIKEKESELNLVKNKINEIIPELKSLQEKGGNGPVAKFYEGRKGIKFILDDILYTLKKFSISEYYIYSTSGLREDIYQAYPEFNKKRIKSKIKAMTISLSPGGGTYGIDERKWLSSNSKEKNDEKMTYILIYSGKCAFISHDNNKNLVGVIIENKMIYETQKAIFMQLWQLI